MPRCSACHGRLEYQSIPNFGDSALGVAAEWMECTDCGKTHPVRQRVNHHTHTPAKGWLS